MDYEGILNSRSLTFNSKYKNINISIDFFSNELYLKVEPPKMDGYLYATKEGIEEALTYIKTQDPLWAVGFQGKDVILEKKFAFEHKLISQEYLDQLITWFDWFFTNVDIYKIDELPF